MVEFYPTPKNPQFQDITGKTFGYQIVIGYHGKRKGNQRWLCRCTCGRERELTYAAVILGSRCRWCAHGAHGPFTHGFTCRTVSCPEYASWSGMKARCYNPHEKNYHNYGGRGILVCERWRTSFLTFWEDMGPRPSPRHSIDRIDNDGNYEPANCRWATRTQQGNNRRGNVYITYHGETHTHQEWARLLGIPLSTLRNRLRFHWPLDEVLDKRKWRGGRARTGAATVTSTLFIK